MWILDYQNFGSSTLMSSDDHAKRQPCNLQRNGWVLLGVTSVVFLEFWQSLLISSISNLEFRQLVGGALVAIIMGECFHFVFSYTGLEITTIKEAQKEMMCTRQMCLTCELSFGMRYVFSCSHLIISWYTVVGLIHRTVWCVLSGVERGVELCISGICPDSRWNWFLSPLSANSKKKLSVISEWPYLYQIYELLLSKKNDGVYSLWC